MSLYFKVQFIVFSIFCSYLFGNTAELERKKPEIKWLSITEALALHKEEPKKIFIDVYTDWCGWCKVMDQKTFKNAHIAEYIGTHFYAVKLDAEQTEDIVFQENTFKFVRQGKRGYHEFAAALLKGNMSFPTVVFLDEELRLIQPVPGYQKPEDLAPILAYFGQDSYKNTPWKDFQETYESPF